MNPFPEPKTRQLLDEISAGYGAGGLSEFQVARLQREAKAMMVKLPAEAHMVLGALAGERHDVDEMHSHHTTSIALRQNEPDMRSNYAVSLARLGLLQEAIDVYAKFRRWSPKI